MKQISEEYEAYQHPRKRVSVIHTIAVKDKTVLYGDRRIHTSKMAAELGREIIRDADKEHLVICCVDVKQQPVSLEVVAIGTATQCVVGMKEVFRNAILSNAEGILVFHNHPSGDTLPSKEDFIITKKLRASGELLGIPVVDHIILGDGEDYTSMAERENWLGYSA